MLSFRVVLINWRTIQVGWFMYYALVVVNNEVCMYVSFIMDINDAHNFVK